MFLIKGAKLLFFTDGLTEAVSEYDPNRYFEHHLVNGLMQKYSEDSPKDFIFNIYGELIEFHGSDLFDDDICMICMDVE